MVELNHFSFLMVSDATKIKRTEHLAQAAVVYSLRDKYGFSFVVYAASD